MPPPSAIVIAGPTGVGKTRLALRLATAVGGKVVSVDSRQIYRRLDIGTAKPTATERAAAVHHLLDLVDPDEVYSAGRFAAAAHDTIAQLIQRGVVPLLVGGSGLYLSAVVDGLFGDPEDVATRPARRAALQERLEREGLAALFDELGRVDAAAQRALSPRDEVRILRALELTSGDRGSRSQRWSRERRPGLHPRPLLIALTRPREELYRRIDRRTEAMLTAGWADEVEGLLAAGVAADGPGLASLGYAEVVAHVHDGVDRVTTVERIQARTRRYAKRQMTWLRRDRRLRWLDLERHGEADAATRIETQWRARKGDARVSAPVATTARQD